MFNTSRYFVKNDNIMRDFAWQDLYFEFYNKGWWSRIYEYRWIIDACANCAGKTVIDIATGIEHPGMFILKSCGFSRVLGIDLFEKDRFYFAGHLTDGIEYRKENILTPTIQERFDCVSCISLMEHIPSEKQRSAMQSIINYMKTGGTLLMTFDMPGYDYRVNFEGLLQVLRDNRLQFTLSESPSTPLTTENSPIAVQELRSMNLKCFRLYATKP